MIIQLYCVCRYVVLEIFASYKEQFCNGSKMVTNTLTDRVYVACDPGIEESTYDDMVANPPSALWYCSKCSHFEPPRNVFNSPALKCVCINVHSICSKKLDLFAYVSAHPYDIAVTETFLDPSISDSEFAPQFYSILGVIAIAMVEELWYLFETIFLFPVTLI